MDSVTSFMYFAFDSLDFIFCLFWYCINLWSYEKRVIHCLVCLVILISSGLVVICVNPLVTPEPIPCRRNLHCGFLVIDFLL